MIKGWILLFSILFSPTEKTKQTDDLYGKVRSVRTYYYSAYDEEGTIEKIFRQYTVSDYDAQGKIVAQNHYNPDRELTYMWTFRYDKSKNNMMKEGFFPYANQASTKLCYNYNEKGHQTEWLLIGNDGITQKWTFKNDANGNKIETLRLNAKGELQDKRIAKYDEYGNVTEERVFYPEQEKEVYTDSYTYELDIQNNWISMMLYRNGKLKEVTERVIEYLE